ncbi:GNAT family N-acetyltransferase [Neobacillus sp. MM2021_6]|uniref:GNAT family N-acetyltransferase n=1 Tax=Bacillaceae TaxID=186817 RepID=UPI001407D41F|nr:MULTISPECIES: GNAT family N-acetyltransferase [Bacillaceae]MBO0962943.1 GNAT family N-acetyltransferase [Neobacillus sp. MM2021_6]NHC19048.1 GNAT family N-acetyltransferase [Bacillus sp. MM2020_4]
MKVIIHKEIDSLEKLLPKWEILYRDFREITVFQDIGWVKSWWYYKSKKDKMTPFIIEIRDEDKTIGIIPLYISQVRFARFNFRLLKPIGSELSDYLIPILSKEYSAEKLLSLAFKKIREDKLNWDCMEWGDIPAESYFLNFLSNQGLKKYSLIEREKADICPFLLVNKNFEEVKKRFSKKFMNNILYNERRLNKDGELKYSRVTSEEEIVPILNKFFELHIERWGITNTPSKFKGVEEREFLLLAAKNLFKSNLLHLEYLSHNGEILGVLFGMSDGIKNYIYHFAINIKFGKYSPGSLIIYYLILEACRDGHEIVDFLRGDEKYKENWGDFDKYNVKYIFFNYSIRSSLFKALKHFYMHEYSTILSECFKILKGKRKRIVHNNYSNFAD